MNLNLNEFKCILENSLRIVSIDEYGLGMTDLPSFGAETCKPLEIGDIVITKEAFPTSSLQGQFEGTYGVLNFEDSNVSKSFIYFSLSTGSKIMEEGEHFEAREDQEAFSPIKFVSGITNTITMEMFKYFDGSKVVFPNPQRFVLIRVA